MAGLILIVFIVVGFILGKAYRKLHNKDNKATFIKLTSLGQNISILILLTMMGYKIGSNQDIIDNFSTLGLHSVLFGVTTLISSCLITFLFVKVINKLHLHITNKHIISHISLDIGEKPSSTVHNYIMIVVFLSLVIIGGILGYHNLLNVTANLLEKIVDGSLMALVFFVGIDMGTSQLSFVHIKSISKSVLIICSGVIVGSLLGSLAIGLLLGYDTLFSISIGSAMGWYSLAGIMLSNIDAQLGAMAFSANLVRELLAIATVPILGSVLSPESAISACGATAMDTALLAITKGLGKQYSVTGFACGIIISSIVPFFLSIIQSIYGIM